MHVKSNRSHEKSVVKNSNYSSPLLSQIKHYNCGNFGHEATCFIYGVKNNYSQHMHASVIAWDLNTRINSGVDEYKFISSAQSQKRKMNKKKPRKNDPLTLVVQPSKRNKGSKMIWVKKYELKENFPLAMCSQEKSQTWEKKKLKSNSPLMT